MIKEEETGMPTADVCRKYGLSPATFNKVKARYGGMDLSDARRLERLEDESAKLKRLLADTMLGQLRIDGFPGKTLTTPKERRDAALRAMRDHPIS